MRKLLLGVMILAIVVGIVGVFWGLSERAKFRKMAEDAEEAKTKVEEERDEALAAEIVASNEREGALKTKAKAEAERDAMADERDKALADFEVEREIRKVAEKKRDEALDKMMRANRELADCIELSRFATETVAFVGLFSNILFPCIDDGDDYYTQGEDLFINAETLKDNHKSLGFINKAKDKYVEAQDKLKRLAYIDDKSREIVEVAQESTAENIKSVEIIRDVLKDMVGKSSMSDAEKQKKADEAAKRKESADRLMIEVCEKFLDVIDTHKEGFTKAQRSLIQELKKKIDKRLGIEEENKNK